MKIQTSFLTALLPIGSDLLQRVTIQGIEPALVAAVVEYGSIGLVRLSRWMKAERNS
ncbi:MAG TPA: hypothetical protein VIB00_18665 [Pyrinomonadaceae bacterium]|jgi:hypothetical protein